MTKESNGDPNKLAANERSVSVRVVVGSSDPGCFESFLPGLRSIHMITSPY